MSAAGRPRSKKGTHKTIKLPFAAPNVPEISDKCENIIDNDEKAFHDFCDELMKSPWVAYNACPPKELFGIYAICKWYSKENQWAVLYVSRGPVRHRLEGHFSGKQRTPIAKYLSSFPKDSRNLIWIKWLKDPYYPYETTDMEGIIKAIGKYNNGERPAFNIDMEVEDERLPENFSIVPDWHK